MVRVRASDGRHHPEIAGVPVAELTYDDWTFLADDVGEDRTTIAFASAAAGLARRTGLPAEAFYGLARFSMPNSFAVFPDIDDAAERRQLLKEVFAALTDSGEDELTQVLDEAVRARTVPSWLGERTRAIAARLNQRAMAETELTLRLVDARTRTPLAGCPAELTDPATEGLTDDSGVVTFRYWAVSDHHDPTAHIAVALPDGSHPTATVAVPDRPGLHPLEVRFDLPDPRRVSPTTTCAFPRNWWRSSPPAASERWPTSATRAGPAGSRDCPPGTRTSAAWPR